MRDEELQYEYGSEEITTRGFLFKTPQWIYSLIQKKKTRKEEKEEE